MQINKGKKTIIVSLSALVLSFTLSFAMAFVFLPEDIYLIEGQEQSFNWNLPLNANIDDEKISVTSINDKPVEGNIHVSLNKEFSVLPKETGTSDVSLSLFGVVPVKTVSVNVIPKTELIPCGKTIGVTMSADGILVLGTGFVNKDEEFVSEPSKDILRSGDLILKEGNTLLNTKEDLMDAIIENGGQPLSLEIKRDGQIQTVVINPVKNESDGTYKIGIWVRDSTQGLGTITYINPYTNKFGALGHGVYDVDTKKIMDIKAGIITEAEIMGIKKGEKGTPGEVLGNVVKDKELGEISINTDYGLYGTIYNNKTSFFAGEPMEIGLKQDIQIGEAYIRTDIIDGIMKDYKIEIEKVNFNKSDDKGMVIRIVDNDLLKSTNGIIQGMSGSPIIQNGKLIGAVTHVFVQDSSKGYGIFIESMLNKEKEVI